MAPEDQIILRAGMLPVITQRARWFEDRNFTSLVRQPPEIPALNVTVALDDGATRILAPQTRTRPITAADVEPEPEDADVE